MSDQPPPLWVWIVFTWGWVVVVWVVLGGYLNDWLRRRR